MSRRAQVMWIKTYFNRRTFIFLLVTSFSEYLLIYLESAVCKAFRSCNNALNLMIEPIELQLPARSLQLDIPKSFQLQYQRHRKVHSLPKTGFSCSISYWFGETQLPNLEICLVERPSLKVYKSSWAPLCKPKNHQSISPQDLPRLSQK